MRNAICVLVKGLDPGAAKEAARIRFPGAIVQAVSARAAANARYVEMIAAQTVAANGTANMLAKKPEIDLLLRLAGTTQISQAIAQVGAKPGEEFLLIVVAGHRTKRAGPGPLLGRTLGRRRLTEEELDGVERAALLNAARG